MSGRLGRYAPIQFMDYAIERGGVSLLLGVLIGSSMVFPMTQMLARITDPNQARGVIQTFFMQTVPLFSWFATLTAVNGIISNDRQKGTFRFLFSKPIGVLRYYAQAWLLHGVGVVLVIALLLGLFSATVRPFFPPRLLLYVSIYYVLLGGIGFFLSALTRKDGAVLAGVWVMSVVVRIWITDRRDIGSRLLGVLLPPSHKTTPLMVAILSGQPLDAAAVWWVVAYGLALFAAGLVVLRYRPMAE